jgi:hypothetical protein
MGCILLATLGLNAPVFFCTHFTPTVCFLQLSYDPIFSRVFVRSKEYSDSEIGKRVGNYFDWLDTLQLFWLAGHVTILTSRWRQSGWHTQHRPRTENSNLLGCVSVSMCQWFLTFRRTVKRRQRLTQQHNVIHQKTWYTAVCTINVASEEYK